MTERLPILTGRWIGALGYEIDVVEADALAQVVRCYRVARGVTDWGRPEVIPLARFLASVDDGSLQRPSLNRWDFPSERATAAQRAHRQYWRQRRWEGH